MIKIGQKILITHKTNHQYLLVPKITESEENVIAE